MAENPFKKTMTRMRFPPDKGVISIAGHQLEADECGEVEVPKEFVEGLVFHGLTPLEENAPRVPLKQQRKA